MADLPATQARVSRNHTQAFAAGGVAPSRSESSGRGLVIASIVMRDLLYSRRAEKPAERQEEEAVIEILREQGGTMNDSVSRPCCDGRSNHCNSEGSNTLRAGHGQPSPGAPGCS